MMEMIFFLLMIFTGTSSFGHSIEKKIEFSFVASIDLDPFSIIQHGYDAHI